MKVKLDATLNVRGGTCLYTTGNKTHYLSGSSCSKEQQEGS